MNTFNSRALDAVRQSSGLTQLLREAACGAGFDDEAQITEALTWTAIQLDPDADDYEVWEATLLARLEDTDKTGER